MAGDAKGAIRHRIKRKLKSGSRDSSASSVSKPVVCRDLTSGNRSRELWQDVLVSEYVVDVCTLPQIELEAN